MLGVQDQRGYKDMQHGGWEDAVAAATRGDSDSRSAVENMIQDVAHVRIKVCKFRTLGTVNREWRWRLLLACAAQRLYVIMCIHAHVVPSYKFSAKGMHT